MTRTEYAIVGCMLVLAGLSLCLLGSAKPALAQTTEVDGVAAAQASEQATSDEEGTAAEKAIKGFCEKVFKPVLAPVFQPIDRALRLLPDKAANVCGVGLFVSAMVWVGLLLNPRYVNRGRPYKSVWTDLRLWTVISMTPHVLVYFYFR